MERTVDNTFLHIARSRLVVHLTEQIRACLAALDDEQIWWRPNERSNAIGNLILHCAGSTRYYIGHVVGGHDFVRDRDSEFGERQKMSTDALRIHLNSTVKEADEVLASFDPARLLFDHGTDTDTLDLHADHRVAAGPLQYACRPDRVRNKADQERRDRRPLANNADTLTREIGRVAA